MFGYIKISIVFTVILISVFRFSDDNDEVVK